MTAAPSTSDGFSRRSVEPKRLRATDFRDRVSQRARDRYAVDLPKDWFHWLLQHQLIPPAARSNNAGLKPVYGFDSRAYRRALQIARLRGEGFKEADAIKIQLFLKRYGEWDIREPLLRQYLKVGRSVLAKVRTTYIDNQKSIPEVQKRKVERSLGPLDNRFETAKLTLSDDQYIEIARTARSPALEWAQQHSHWEKNPNLTSISFEGFAKWFMPFFTGLWLFSEKEDAQLANDDYITELIMEADVSQRKSARVPYYTMTRTGVSEHLLGLLKRDVAKDVDQDLTQAVSSSVRYSAGWAAIMLVIGLVAARASKISISEDQVDELMRFLTTNNLSLADLVVNEMDVTPTGKSDS